MAYVDAGYFLDDYILETATVPRALGDDGGVLRRFWKAKAAEWLDKNIDRLQGAKRIKAKRKVIEVIIEAAERMEEPPLPQTVIAEISARMDRPEPDYTAIAAMLIEGMEQQRRKIQRRRNMEALLVLEW